MSKDCPRFWQRGIANLGWIIGLVFLGLLLPASVRLAQQEQRLTSQAEDAIYPHGIVKTQAGEGVIGSRVTVTRAYDGKVQISPSRTGYNPSEYWLVGFSRICGQMTVSAIVRDHQVLGYEYQGQFHSGQAFTFDPCVAVEIDIVVLYAPWPTTTPTLPVATTTPVGPTPTGSIPADLTPTPGGCLSYCQHNEARYTEGGNYCAGAQRYVCTNTGSGCLEWVANSTPCSPGCNQQCDALYGDQYPGQNDGVGGVCSSPGLPDNLIGCSNYGGGGSGWGSSCVIRNYLVNPPNTTDCSESGSVCRCYSIDTTALNCSYTPPGEPDPCNDRCGCFLSPTPTITPTGTIIPTGVQPTLPPEVTPTAPVPTATPPALPCTVTVTGTVAAGNTITLTCAYSGLATKYRFTLWRSTTLPQTIYEGPNASFQYLIPATESGCFKFQCLPISE